MTERKMMMVNAGKKNAALAAVKLIQDNMVVGLGTGSTAKFFIEGLAEQVQQDQLHNITCVATSIASDELGRSLGLHVVALDETDGIDITIDGADEVDPQLNGIKGGGAALFYEKIVAKASKKNIWIVDPSKQSPRLGTQFKLPVEVLPFGSHHVFNYLTDLSLDPHFRVNADGQYLLTDSANYIIDVDISEVTDLKALGDELIQHTGIVEHGLFLGICDTLIVGTEPTTILNRNN
ncbi:ribose-5-phosphate isomerase RpiA [Weissella viridescens]|nr:ribose-5-phosphate isomerase RpiA [Weissella viridescens]